MPNFCSWLYQFMLFIPIACSFLSIHDSSLCELYKSWFRFHQFIMPICGKFTSRAFDFIQQCNKSQNISLCDLCQLRIRLHPTVMPVYVNYTSCVIDFIHKLCQFMWLIPFIDFIHKLCQLLCLIPVIDFIQQLCRFMSLTPVMYSISSINHTSFCD